MVVSKCALPGGRALLLFCKYRILYHIRIILFTIGSIYKEGALMAGPYLQVCKGSYFVRIGAARTEIYDFAFFIASKSTLRLIIANDLR